MPKLQFRTGFCKYLFLGILISLPGIFTSTALAQSVPLSERPANIRSSDALVYHGKLVRPSGAVINGNLSVQIEIYSPEPSVCLLWSETQSLTAQNGAFSLELGYAENRKTGASAGAASVWRDVFLNNPGLTISSATCQTGSSYTPTVSDDRLMKATFNDGGTVVTAEFIPIKSVPFAMQAREIGGYGINNIVKVSGAGSSSIVLSPDELSRIKTFAEAAPGTSNQVLGMNAAGNGLEYKSITAGSNVTITQSAGGIQISSSGGGGGGGPITSGDVTSALGFTPLSTIRILDIKSTVGANPAWFNVSGACPAGQNIGFNSVTDRMECGGFTLTTSQVTAALGFTPLSGVVAADVSSALGYTPVNKTGDSMTGALSLPSNGLSVGTNQFVVSGGNVGIGTSSPQVPLHVVGKVVFGEDLTPTHQVFAPGTGYLEGYLDSNNPYVAGISKSQGNHGFTGFGPYAGIVGIGEYMGVESYAYNSTGDVWAVAGQGLGFPGPTDTMTAVGGAMFDWMNEGTGTITNGVGIRLTRPSYNSGTVVNSIGLDVLDQSRGTVQNAYGIKIANQSGDPNTRWSIYTGTAKSYFGGNVGIGTTSPAYKLDVSGDVNISGNFKVNGVNIATGGGTVTNVDVGGLPLSVVNSSSTPTISIAQANTSTAGFLSSADWNLFNNKQPAGSYLTAVPANSVGTGEVNDGTLAPADLNFAGSMATNTGVVVRNGTQFFNKTCAGNEALIWSVANGWICSALVLSESDPQVGANTTNMLSKWDGSALVASGVFESGGNVGIGTTSPSTKLDVNGTITATGFSGPMTSSVVGVGSGSNSTPSMSFSGDPDTGFYNTSSNNTISVAAGGAKIFDLSSSGIVSPTTGGANITSANGTVSNPTYSFAGDPGTGWWRPAASMMAASTGGTERMRIDSSGNVGIGTTSPSTLLHLSGPLADLTIDRDNAGYGGNVIFQRQGATKWSIKGENTSGQGDLAFNNASTTSVLTLLQSGNVGVGTTSPNAKLEIQSTGSDTSPLRIRTNGSPGNYTPANSGLFVYDAAGNETLRIFASDPDIDNNFNAGNLYIGLESGISNQTNNTSAGLMNVGVGASSLRNVTTGQQNTAIGVYAGRNLSTGSGNTLLGTWAGGDVVIGDGNVAVGNSSNVGTGSYNLSIGSGSAGNLSSGDRNIFIGNESATNLTTASNNIVIGALNNFAASSSMSNSVVIGSNLSLSGNMPGNNSITIADGSGNRRINILSNGNVGIGTTSPSTLLHLSGPLADLTIDRDNAGYGGNVIFQRQGATKWSIKGENTSGQGDLAFNNASTTSVLTLLQSGNVGIGTSTPDARLAVDANGGSVNLRNAASGVIISGGTSAAFNDTYIAISPIGAASTYGVINAWDNDFGARNLALQTVAGNVGIGTTSPSYKLHVVGTAGLSSGTAWTNASDIRLKDIHGDYEYGLDEVLKLHTVRYNYKKGNALGLPSDFEKTGFIAQEVQEVIPDAVKAREDGYLELNVDPIHWAVVNAIKEFYAKWFADSEKKDAEIRQLKAENQQIKAENSAIKGYLCEKDPGAFFCK